MPNQSNRELLFIERFCKVFKNTDKMLARKIALSENCPT